MIEEVDAGPILALRRFSVEETADEEGISVAAYGNLLWLAAEVADGLGDPSHQFERLPISWGPTKTTRRDYLALISSPPGGPAASPEPKLPQH